MTVTIKRIEASQTLTYDTKDYADDFEIDCLCKGIEPSNQAFCAFIEERIAEDFGGSIPCYTTYHSDQAPTDQDPAAKGGALSNAERYIAAACRKFQGDTDVSISLNAPVDTDTIGGAWVSALIFVADDELEPTHGPSYGVFLNELDWRPTGPAWGGWTLDERFSCDDDSDGKQAQAAAHQHARGLRATYPAALVAVRKLSATNWAPRTPRLPG